MNRLKREAPIVPVSPSLCFKFHFFSDFLIIPEKNWTQVSQSRFDFPVQLFHSHHSKTERQVLLSSKIFCKKGLIFRYVTCDYATFAVCKYFLYFLNCLILREIWWRCLCFCFVVCFSYRFNSQKLWKKVFVGWNCFISTVENLNEI